MKVPLFKIEIAVSFVFLLLGTFCYAQHNQNSQKEIEELVKDYHSLDTLKKYILKNAILKWLHSDAVIISATDKFLSGEISRWEMNDIHFYGIWERDSNYEINISVLNRRLVELEEKRDNKIKDFYRVRLDRFKKEYGLDKDDKEFKDFVNSRSLDIDKNGKPFNNKKVEESYVNYRNFWKAAPPKERLKELKQTDESVSALGALFKAKKCEKCIKIVEEVMNE